MPSSIKNINKFVAHARNLALSLIFPIECLGCKKEDVWLCKSCFRKLEFKNEQYCLLCKKVNKFGEFCSKCQEQYSLNGVWIAGDYENKIIAELIKNLKYRFAKNIAQTLGNFLSLFLRNLINITKIESSDLNAGVNWRKFENITKSPQALIDFKNVLLIPVPLHKKRERWRGFNQSLVIAYEIAKIFNLIISNQLIREKHKKPQAKLGESDRKINIKGCYTWQGEKLQGENIILIDDVTTTGSTLNECAYILKQAGAGEIWGLVVAKG
ncbi:MAG: double zinc ribbon domain-containing protein [Patescibacteria group bacterium]